MVSTKKNAVLAVLMLSGGNDGLNTVIPYNNPLYRDYRPNIGVPEDQIIPINNELGFHPTMAPLKKYWDEGNLAIILGIGYPNPSLSHFRSMDIWATCEPDIGNERDDPQHREQHVGVGQRRDAVRDQGDGGTG